MLKVFVQNMWIRDYHRGIVNPKPWNKNVGSLYFLACHPSLNNPGLSIHNYTQPPIYIYIHIQTHYLSTYQTKIVKHILWNPYYWRLNQFKSHLKVPANIYCIYICMVYITQIYIHHILLWFLALISRRRSHFGYINSIKLPPPFVTKQNTRSVSTLSKLMCTMMGANSRIQDLTKLLPFCGG